VRIGVDFDNTIVCYDDLFWKVATERGLIPAGLPAAKDAVRAHLRRDGREQAWTEMQGHVYGPRMREARPFPGALELLARARQESAEVFVISHRTRFPYLGERHDLHEAARDWIAAHGLHDPSGVALPEGHVFFEESKAAKLARIAQVGCTDFVDDLPELLMGPGFPDGVRRILFDPGATGGDHPALARAGSWDAVGELLFGRRS
jgi:hypothetical protein